MWQWDHIRQIDRCIHAQRKNHRVRLFFEYPDWHSKEKQCEHLHYVPREWHNLDHLHNRIYFLESIITLTYIRQSRSRIRMNHPNNHIKMIKQGDCTLKSSISSCHFLHLEYWMHEIEDVQKTDNKTNSRIKNKQTEPTLSYIWELDRKSNTWQGKQNETIDNSKNKKKNRQNHLNPSSVHATLLKTSVLS